MEKINTITIYYDGECPFCDNYSKLLLLKESVENVLLINLREHPEIVNKFRDQGFDVDQGMIVDKDSQIYHGAQAINLLASLSSNTSTFNKLNSKFFSNEKAANLLYPFLVMGRNALLFILGKTKLVENQNKNSQLILFVWLWSIFSVLHVFYDIAYNAHLYISTYGVLLFGVIGIFKPSSIRIFSLLIFFAIIDAWQQMPSNSNHTIIKNFLLLSILISAIVTWSKSQNRAMFFNYFAPCGRILLVVMYFFGVFHKLNTDFLNPEVSCATALWQKMPLGLNNLDAVWIQYLTIYGALIIEAIILLALFSTSWRRLGILIGICFHSILALSSYAFYVPFSMLTIALHVLFFNSNEATTIINGKTWASYKAFLNTPLGIVLTCLWISLIYNLAELPAYSFAGILWLLFVVAFVYLLLSSFQFSLKPHFNNKVHIKTKNNFFTSKSWTVNLISILFVFNGLTPYLGLKTAQSMNMFANLQVENSSSNHLLLKNYAKPYTYLDDLVIIKKSEGSPYLLGVKHNNLLITYYDLLDKVSSSPLIEVSYRRNGKLYTNQNSVTLKVDINKSLHHKWFRKWFHFSRVDLTSPKPCQ